MSFGYSIFSTCLEEEKGNSGEIEKGQGQGRDGKHGAMCDLITTDTFTTISTSQRFLNSQGMFDVISRC